MVKHTDKVDKLIALVESNPTVFIGKPDWNAITTKQAINYAYMHGYSWNQHKHEWFFSTSRERKNRVERVAGPLRNGAAKLNIRFMGPIEGLPQLAADFGELAELIGLRVLTISQPTPNEDSKTWGRIYITAERL